MKPRSANLADALDSLDKGKWLVPEELRAIKNWRSMVMDFGKEAMCFHSVYDDCAGLKPVSELLKLPFPVCWIQADMESRDVSVGFLLIQKDENAPIYGFMISCLEDKRWCWSATLELEPGRKAWNGPPEAQASARAFVEWLSCYLSALNCVNIKRVEHKPQPSKNSVRRAMGRRPLFSYWTLEIDLDRSGKEAASYGGTHASPRLHLRRGHARQYAPGLWCWVNAHAVGSKAAGVIHKDYAVKGAQ